MKVTQSELEFLLRDADSWPEVRGSLGLNDALDAETLAAAGAMSMIQRGLARMAGADVMVSDDAVALVRRLVTRGQSVVSVEQRRADEVSIGAFLDGESPTLVSALAPGVLEVTPLTGEATLDAVALALAVDGDSVVRLACRGVRGDASVTFSHDHGSWRLWRDGQPASASRDEVAAAIKLLREWQQA